MKPIAIPSTISPERLADVTAGYTLHHGPRAMREMLNRVAGVSRVLDVPADKREAVIEFIRQDREEAAERLNRKES